MVDKEKTPVGGGPQNTKQRFVKMVDVAALLEQEKAKARKDFIQEDLRIPWGYSANRIPISISSEPSHSMMVGGEVSLSI